MNEVFKESIEEVKRQKINYWKKHCYYVRNTAPKINQPKQPI